MQILGELEFTESEAYTLAIALIIEVWDKTGANPYAINPVVESISNNLYSMMHKYSASTSETK